MVKVRLCFQEAGQEEAAAHPVISLALQRRRGTAKFK
jgi:hypothetical protein